MVGKQNINRMYLRLLTAVDKVPKEKDKLRKVPAGVQVRKREKRESGNPRIIG